MCIGVKVTGVEGRQVGSHNLWGVSKKECDYRQYRGNWDHLKTIQKIQKTGKLGMAHRLGKVLMY